MKMGSEFEAKIQTGEMLKWLLAIGLGLVICLFTAQPGLRASEKGGMTLDSPLTASQVVSRMVEMRDHRKEALRSYTSLRTYHLELHGLISLHANMEVKMTYRYPGVKDFTILSQSGSAYVRNHVFKRILKAENLNSHQSEKRHIAITPENYNFELTGYEQNDQGGFYILNVTPKVKNKYLFKGRIWVDGKSFSIVRIEGQPSETLSWWTPKVNFVYQYKKVGEFWFPASNKTITHVRIFGHSLLTIHYKDYDLTDALRVQPLTAAKVSLSDRTPDMSLIPSQP
ncbi:MAG: hypothetical protein P8Z30_04720 [Acidobacteriota bacterium]